MDIDVYTHQVRERLEKAAARRNSISSATFGPLAPIEEQRRKAQESLLAVCTRLKEEREAAVKQLAIEIKERRQSASREAAKIREEADQRAKEIRRKAKEDNETARASLMSDFAARQAAETRSAEETIASLEQKEAAARAEISGEIEAAESVYRNEYEEVIAERIFTRNALSKMGFTAPVAKRTSPDSDEQKAQQS